MSTDTVVIQGLVGPDGTLHHLRIGAGVAERHGSSIGGDRVTAANGDVAVGDEWPPFALTTEAECLELADDFERERVVEFQHIHVSGPDAGVAECTFSRASSDDAVDVTAVITAPAGEVPGRWVLV